MSLVAQAVLGAFLGIAAGVFFGDACAVLQPVGTLYVMGLESVMYPVVVCSIIGGLAKLTPEITRKLLRRGWVVLLGTWALTLSVVWVLSLALPQPQAAIVDTAPATRKPGLLNMLIPSNFFVDLVHNFLPAIVIFSVFYGVAVQKSRNKTALMTVLEVIYEGGLKVWSWIVRLAPYGVFALMAVTAGSVRVDVLPALIAYVVLFTVGCLLLGFCFLPWLLSSLSPLPLGRIFHGMRTPLTLTLATTLPVVSLPYIQDLLKKLLDEQGLVDEDDIGGTTLSVFYGLAQMGNCFVYLTVLFGAFYYEHPLTFAQQALLPPVVVLSSIGTPSATVNAVSFLGDWLGLPGDIKNFYAGTMSFTRYPQILLSVMGFNAMTVVVMLSYYGRLRIEPLQLGARFAAILLVLLGVGLGARALEPHLRDAGENSLATHDLGGAHVKPVPFKISSDDPPERGEALDLILRRKILRVGVNLETVPFVYHNSAGDLVGYDVAFACELARALDCGSVVFVPFQWNNLDADIEAGRFDIAMSGIYVDNQRLSQVAFSDPYFDDTLGLIVPRDAGSRFGDYASIREALLDVAIFKSDALSALVKRFFPSARTTVVSGYDQLPSTRFDAALWTREQAQAWCVLHPDYVAAMPQGLDFRVLLGYAVRADSQRLLGYVNYWLRLKQAEGFSARQRHYWIEGKDLPDPTPRWCISRDLLHLNLP